MPRIPRNTIASRLGPVKVGAPSGRLDPAWPGNCHRSNLFEIYVKKGLAEAATWKNFDSGQATARIYLYFSIAARPFVRTFFM
jgi:hypothetical protein